MMINIAMIACILYESIAMELVAAGGVNQKSDGKRFVDSILEGIVFHLAIQRLIWRGSQYRMSTLHLLSCSTL